MRFFIFLLFPLVCLGQTAEDQIQDYFDHKEYQKAEVFAQTLLENEPSNPIFTEFLGDAYSYQKQFDKAKNEYQKLVLWFPDSANYHYKFGAVLGLIARDANKWKALRISSDIAKHLKKAAHLDMQHIDARWALVELYVQLPGIVGGSKKKALKYAQELENISPIDGYIAKGYVYEYKGNPEKAKMYYNMAIDHQDSSTYFNALNQSEEQPTFHRNALYYQIGKIAAEYNVKLVKGEQCLLTYIQEYTIKDGIPIKWAYLRLAQIYKHKQDKVKALYWVERALAQQQGFEEAVEEKAAIELI